MHLCNASQAGTRWYIRLPLEKEEIIPLLILCERDAVSDAIPRAQLGLSTRHFA